jgi:hypothetical protein
VATRSSSYNRFHYSEPHEELTTRKCCPFVAAAYRIITSQPLMDSPWSWLSIDILGSFCAHVGAKKLAMHAERSFLGAPNSVVFEPGFDSGRGL